MTPGFFWRLAPGLALVAALSACSAATSTSTGGPSTTAAQPGQSTTASPAVSGGGTSPADPAWVTARTRTGSQPCGVLGAAGSIWVSDFTDGTLVRLDPSSGHQVGRPLQVGAQPCGMAFGAGSIWLPDYGEPTLVRV